MIYLILIAIFFAESIVFVASMSVTEIILRKLGKNRIKNNCRTGGIRNYGIK